MYIISENTVVKILNIEQLIYIYISENTLVKILNIEQFII